MLSLCDHYTEKAFGPGEIVLRQGEKKDQLLVLETGLVEVVKNGTQICTISERGAVLGEISALLSCYQSASVCTLKPSTFFVIEHAEEFLKQQPAVALFLARILARRLALLDSHFADIKSKMTLLQGETMSAAKIEPGLPAG
jgi:CRP-like cAMP-binding protein